MQVIACREYKAFPASRKEENAIPHKHNFEVPIDW